MTHQICALTRSFQARASDLVLRRREAASKARPELVEGGASARASVGVVWIILRDAMLRIALRMRSGIAAPHKRPGLGVTFTLALAISAAPAAAQTFKAGDIVVEKPWARATPKGAEVASGYLVIRNNGAAPDRLTGGSADFAAVEIHQMTSEGGVTQMRELKDGLTVPAHGSVGLSPGGYHVMFTHLAHPLTKGENVKATLNFEHAGPVEVEFKVVGVGASGAGAAPGGSMGGMKM
jgi:periplasmic copper chaperone A